MEFSRNVVSETFLPFKKHFIADPATLLLKFLQMCEIFPSLPKFLADPATIFLISADLCKFTIYEALVKTCNFNDSNFFWIAIFETKQ